MLLDPRRLSKRKLNYVFPNVVFFFFFRFMFKTKAAFYTIFYIFFFIKMQGALQLVNHLFRVNFHFNVGRNRVERLNV